MQNPREIRGSKWSKAVYFERILVRIVRVWARLSSFSSNPCSKAVQNDHIRGGKDDRPNESPGRSSHSEPEPKDHAQDHDGLEPDRFARHAERLVDHDLHRLAIVTGDGEVRKQVLAQLV